MGPPPSPPPPRVRNAHRLEPLSQTPVSFPDQVVRGPLTGLVRKRHVGGFWVIAGREWKKGCPKFRYFIFGFPKKIEGVMELVFKM